MKPLRHYVARHRAKIRGKTMPDKEMMSRLERALLWLNKIIIYFFLITIIAKIVNETITNR